MHALMLGPAEKARAEEIVAHARAHIYRPGPRAVPPGMDLRHVAHFQVGCRCVFSFTQVATGIYRLAAPNDVDRCLVLAQQIPPNSIASALAPSAPTGKS
jgi:hypothetical protein